MSVSVDRFDFFHVVGSRRRFYWAALHFHFDIQSSHHFAHRFLKDNAMTSAGHISKAELLRPQCNLNNYTYQYQSSPRTTSDIDLATMDLLRLALFLLAIFSTTTFADHIFANCSSLERVRIRISLQHAQSLIATATVRGSSDSIEIPNLSDTSQELNEMNRRWRADIYKTIAMELPQITFTCTTDNTTIQAMCDAAPNSTPRPAKNLPPLFVKTDTGILALCQDRAPQDHRYAALPIAHELIEIAKKIESDKRADEVIEKLAAIDKHAQEIIEALRSLLLSLDNYYVTDFWQRTMNWYSEIMGRITAMMA